MACRVDGKRCWMTFAAVFVAVAAVSMLYNGVCLKGPYSEFAQLWRPQARMKTLFPLVFLSYAVFAFAFMSIYVRGYEPEKPPLGQGIRFALLAWPLASVWGQLGGAPFMNVPLRFVGYWMLDGLLCCLAAGIVAGLLYRPAEGGQAA